MDTHMTLKASLAALAIGFGLATSGEALALDEVSYGTNWLAQAEHGGFYQAVADGTYEKHGLKVTIIQGGPNAANRALLIAGKVDFYMGGPLGDMDAVKEGIPMISVASIFQKDPQVLLAHPNAGVEKFEDLAKLDKVEFKRLAGVTIVVTGEGDQVDAVAVPSTIAR